MAVSLYSISDDYIVKLSMIEPKVLSNHQDNRKYMRPYIGFLVKINNYDYFLPLSSPDKKDYDKNKNVLSSTLTILRMTNSTGNFLGKILLNNMIPVPQTEISFINIRKVNLSNISDPIKLAEQRKENQYKDLLIDESQWINSHLKLISKNANVLYIQKVNENNHAYWKNNKVPNYLKATVDFRLLENALSKVC